MVVFYITTCMFDENAIQEYLKSSFSEYFSKIKTNIIIHEHAPKESLKIWTCLAATMNIADFFFNYSLLCYNS